MEENVDYVRLVRRAQLGDKDCLGRLTEAVEKRLRADVYRLTLQHDLTEDIVQETMLKMLKMFDELKEAERFWPWLYKIALNKIRHHHRTEQSRRTVPLSAVSHGREPEDSQEAMSNMVSQELKQIVVKAMRQLKPQHRAVLTMRCYREMEYSLIAETMGCSEFAAKMLFYRAKKAMQKQLSRAGFGKGSLLVALVLFGKMTAPSEAAQVSVTTAATKVSAAAGLVGVLTSKTAVLSLVTAGILGIGTVVGTSGPNKGMGVSGQGPAGSLQVMGQSEQSGEVPNEYWYFFPKGTDAAMMSRSTEGNSKGKHNYCHWMQDEQANYYFERRENTVYINDYRQYNGNLAVWRLPTDRPGLREFLSQVEGESQELEYVSSKAPGLMVVVKRNENGSSLWTTRHFHVLSEEYFRYNWPAGAKVIDNRDEMHKRGWTYFKITGRMDGERVSGEGRIPFVYAASEQYRPWIRLQVRNRLKIVDGGSEALFYDGRGRVMASYAGGSFFKGLSRPWMGLHTIDTVRRDAAEQKVWFETKYEAKEGKAEVELTCEQGKLVYTIDMQKDVIDKITISANDRKGELRFSYLQDIGEAGSEFVEPRISRSYGSKRRAGSGMLWLFEVAFGG